MSGFWYFAAALGFCMTVLAYAAAVGEDPPDRPPESSLDL